MLFHYEAVDTAGKKTDGDFEGQTIQDALRFLSSKELRPVSVKSAKESASANKQLFVGSINTSDKVFLTKYLALMLRVGTDLLAAINILIGDFDKPAVHNLLLEVRDNLTKGDQFYVAFSKHPRDFSPTFINLIKAAEESGNLQKTFEDLSGQLEKEASLRSKVRSALIYPLILLLLASAILVFLTTFALPKVANVFAQSGVHPPFFSEIVFAVGLFIGGNILIIAPTIVIVLVTIALLVTKTDVGRRVFERVLQNLPVLKTIYNELAVQRMASTMSSLMNAGLPISQTITVAADTVGVRDYRDALLRVVSDGLEKGLTIGEAFRREPVFPKMVSNLVAISEKAGHLGEVLSTLADFYAANVDADIKTLVSLVEPMMLLGMGVMVGVIALSIIVPIYQLTTQF